MGNKYIGNKHIGNKYVGNTWEANTKTAGLENLVENIWWIMFNLHTGVSIKSIKN